MHAAATRGDDPRRPPGGGGHGEYRLPGPDRPGTLTAMPTPEQPATPPATAPATDAATAPSLVDLWPLAGVRVTSGDLELRYLDDTLLFDLARLAGQGVHGTDFMPFTVPWTRGTPTEVGRSVLAYQWGNRAGQKPEDWRIELGVVRDGEVLGIQGAYAKQFPVLRTVETGSWLGLAHQGAGVGTRMRLMMLHLLFDGLGTEIATTGAFSDNERSLGVTRRLGYAANGEERTLRDGTWGVTRRFTMTREQWDARPEGLRPPVTLVGVDALREQLLPPDPGLSTTS